MDAASSAGIAYGKLSRSLRRRRNELIALLEAGEVPATLAKSYEADHPLEPPVATYEVEAALAVARARSPRRPSHT